ncbi:MAG: hypothetical protein ACI9K9_000466, partial [Neolewinella sp.]
HGHQPRSEAKAINYCIWQRHFRKRGKTLPELEE